jgi:hypothetical protein
MLQSIIWARHNECKIDLNKYIFDQLPIILMPSYIAVLIPRPKLYIETKDSVVTWPRLLGNNLFPTPM